MIPRSHGTRALLVELAAVAALLAPAASDAAGVGQMMVVTPQSVKFIQIPGMPSCASAAILRGDPRTGPAWVLLKLASGCRVPWHWHTANEDLLVISGQGSLPMKDGPPLPFVPGAYASLPSKHVHQAICTRSCLFFNSADAAFDVHYVDANGQEIAADQALAQPVKPHPAKPKRKKK
jgi:quercetin dioxygenase-like cupin family protein